jgi:ribosomal protein S20
MEDIQIIELGEQARKLGVDPVFQAIITDVKQQQLMLIAATKPEETEVRESAYHLIRALDSITSQLVVKQNQGERAKARVTKKQNGSSNKQSTK